MNTSQQAKSDRENIIVPPHNDAAETSCLGAVFISNTAFYEVEEVFSGSGAATFYRESSRHIWRAFEELFNEYSGDISTNPIDIISVVDKLNSKGLLEAVGGPHEIAKLSSFVPSAANISYYARIVKKYHKLRIYHQNATVFYDRTSDAAEDPDELIREIVAQLAALITPDGGKRKNTLATDRIWQDRFTSMLSGKVAGYSTGIAQLDALLDGGLQPGRSYYLGGLTKMGKTTLALHLAAQWAFVHGGAVDWWSVEMSEEDLEDKFLGWLTGFSPGFLLETLRDKTTKQNTKDKMFAELIDARTRFVEADIEFEISGSPDISHIEAATLARQTRLQGEKPLLLVVDYMQNLSNGNSKAGEYERLSDISRRLNGISKDRKIVVIVLFQFDKEAEKAWMNQRKIPRFSNLRGTSQAGNDANHFLILHRNWRDMPESEYNERYCELLQDLSRHGKLGQSIELDCYLETCRFSTWDHERNGQPPGAEKWANQQANQQNKSRY